MNFQEDTQYSNMSEEYTENENDINFLISQKEEILINMESEEQKEKNLKEFMGQQQKMLQEKLKFCYELKKENEFMKENSKKELKERNELVKNLISANEAMNNNVENFHLLRDSMQLCINYQQESNELKQEVLENFEKIKHKNDVKEQEQNKKLNDLSELLNNCKLEHLNNCEYLDNIYDKNIQEILQYKGDIINIQNEITNYDERANKIMEEINILKDNDLKNKNSELIKQIEEFNLEKDIKESKYKLEISELSTEQANLNESHLTLEKECEDLQKGLYNKKEFLKSLNNQKKIAEDTFSNLNITYNDKEKDINDLIKQQKIDLEEHNNNINTLNTKIKELQENNKLREKEKQILDQQFSDLNNKENELNAELLDLETSSIEHENALKKELQLFEENQSKFETEIDSLRKILQEENQIKISLEEKEQELEAQIDEVQEKYEELNIKSDAASAEAEAEEITINLNVDKIKSAIEEEKCAIEELKKDINQNKIAGEAKLNKLEIKYEEKMKKLTSKYAEIKDKLYERNENDEKTKSEVLKKLKDSKTTLELQMSELKVSTQNLQNELDLKIKEHEKLAQELNALNDKIVLNDSKESHNFKRPKYDFKIPKCKIPQSKYSSTSDSSLEDLSLAKRRKIAFKRRSEKKSTPSQKSIEPQDSQKSIDDIFANLKVTGEKKPIRKKSIKKPVY